jgi:hypothetical protein
LTETATGFPANGDVVVTYWSDFVVPTTYTPPLNDSPDLDETWGEWTGKPIVAGSYTVGLWGYVTRWANYDRTPILTPPPASPTPDPFPDRTQFRGTSNPMTVDFLLGSPPEVQPIPYTVIPDSGATCYSCHNDLWFHGAGRRGFDTCLLCHGTVASEDRATWARTSALPTTGVAMSFRELLHKIHMGEELPSGANYKVEGNSTYSTYEHVVFPALGGPRACERCHGTNTTWWDPPPRDHPTAQGIGVRVWGFVCGSCHDSSSAHAHIDVNTTPAGAEACATCHGENGFMRVQGVHIVR